MRKALRALANWLAGAFEEKRDIAGFRRASMLRWSVATFTAAMAWRFIYRPPVPLLWTDVVVVALVLFAVPIAKALDAAPAELVVRSLTDVLKRPVRRPEDPAAPPQDPPADLPHDESVAVG